MKLAALLYLTLCIFFGTFVLARIKVFRMTIFATVEEIQTRLVSPSKDFDARNLSDGQYHLRRQESKVNKYLHRIILAPSHQAACYNDSQIIILIHSHPSNLDKRQVIRHTWGQPIQMPDLVTWPGKKTCCRGARLFFLLGSDPNLDAAIRDEQSQHDDIFQGSFVETGQSSTLKSLFGLKIVSELCLGVKYLLKSEDSTVLNIPLLLGRLEQLRARRAIVGRVVENQRAVRDDVNLKEFGFDKYPPYSAGSSYVITADIIGQLLETSYNVPYVSTGDVYVTGILGRVLGVNHISLGDGPRITVDRPYSEERTACDVIQQRLLASTNMGFEEQIILWNQLRSPSSCDKSASLSTIAIFNSTY